MKYKESINLLSDFDVIIVTGPQRSGTTIASVMIGMDLGFKVIDEEEFLVYDFDFMVKTCSLYKKYVVHCPAMFHKLEDVNLALPNAALVVMKRDIKDIQNSQKRIKWNEAYDKKITGCLNDSRTMSEIDYEKFYFIKNKLSFPLILEMEYESLIEHELWVDKSMREGFRPKQWKVYKSFL